MENRTVADFVEDKVSDGRTPREVLVIAENSCWRNNITEIREELTKFSKKSKKSS